MRKMVVAGSVPYRNFKEKLRLINDLQREFHHKVKIRDENGLITYSHVQEVNQDRSVLNVN